MTARRAGLTLGSMAESARPSVRDALVKLADHGIEAAEAYGRTDLVPRLHDLRAAASEPYVRVLVAGEFKQGKSSLVNALVGHEVCPVDDDVATSVPTSVRYAPEPVAVAVTAGDGDGAPTRHPVDPGDIAGWVTESGEQSALRPLLVEVGVPAESLRGGLELVDLPGAGGLGSFHGAATLAALDGASAIVFVSDAVQELTATERAFLGEVTERCPAVALAKTKVDLHPSWRSILDRDRAHVAEATSIVVGVSARARPQGRRERRRRADRGVGRARSWRPGWPRRWSRGRGSRLAVVVADEVHDVCGQLRAPFDAERAALDDPDPARRAAGPARSGAGGRRAAAHRGQPLAAGPRRRVHRCRGRRRAQPAPPGPGAPAAQRRGRRRLRPRRRVGGVRAEAPAGGGRPRRPPRR